MSCWLEGHRKTQGQRGWRKRQQRPQRRVQSQEPSPPPSQSIVGPQLAPHRVVRGRPWGRGSDVTVPRVTPLPRDTAVTHKNMLESAADLAISRGYRVEK